MKLRLEVMEALCQEVGQKMRPGEELVVAGPVALLGTSRLAEERQEELRARFSRNYVYEASRLDETYRVPDAFDWKPWEEEAGISLRFPMGEGGFLTALWKAAEVSQVGLSVDLRRVPIRQESVELCEFLGFNPYEVHAGGACLLSARRGYLLAERLRQQGLMAAVIGTVSEGKQRLLLSGSIQRHLDRPEGYRGGRQRG